MHWVAMASAEAAVARGLAKWVELSKNNALDPHGFLTAEWSSDDNCVLYGCSVCVPLLRDERLSAPHRYRDPAKSRMVAHANMQVDLKRAIPVHAESNNHTRAHQLLKDWVRGWPIGCDAFVWIREPKGADAMAEAA